MHTLDNHMVYKVRVLYSTLNLANAGSVARTGEEDLGCEVAKRMRLMPGNVVHIVQQVRERPCAPPRAVVRAAHHGARGPCQHISD